MKIVIIVLLFQILPTISQAQNEQNPPHVYRIVAVSTTDSTIRSFSNEIMLFLPMQIYLPTAFTPNGDGLNDDFGAVGEGIEKYHLRIFNRWGQVIFETENVSNKWDGSYKGKLAPLGEYSYELLAHGKEFGEVYKFGSVLLID